MRRVETLPQDGEVSRGAMVGEMFVATGKRRIARLVVRSICLGLSCWSLTVAAQDNETQGSMNRIGERAAGCAAYFFMSANAKGVADFERFYRAGEFSYNESVKRLGNAAALQHFNEASREMNAVMGSAWNDFHRVEAAYDDSCSDLMTASQTPPS